LIEGSTWEQSRITWVCLIDIEDREVTSVMSARQCHEGEMRGRSVE